MRASEPRTVGGVPGAGDLSIERVGKVFAAGGREFEALRDVSVHIREGEFLSVVGASGCGKSTLLRIVAGLESADRGAVRLGGDRVVRPGRDRGMVFQEHRLFPWLTVEENVAFALDGDPSRASCDVVQEHVALVGLASFRHAYPHQLSGGMAQRAALARALVNRPRVLLLDEPFGALDALTRIQLQQQLLRIREVERTTMVLVTHDVDEAIVLGDRVAVMSNRPGTISRMLQIDLPRPRLRSSYEFVQLRRSIYAEFFGEAEEPFTYAI